MGKGGGREREREADGFQRIGIERDTRNDVREGVVHELLENDVERREAIERERGREIERGGLCGRTTVALSVLWK
jgi:hypothetical protein